MRICILTGSSLRHTALIDTLSRLTDAKVTAIREWGIIPEMSGIMKEYFSHVERAERDIFGSVYLKDSVTTYTVPFGTLSNIPFIPDADHYVVFGSSYIKGWLCDYLIQKRAINIHMGIAPEYRGSDCNFWAMFDERPDLVGATIHLLSAGLDSGDILRIVRTMPYRNPFMFTMAAVKAAHSALRDLLEHQKPLQPIPQNIGMEIRYTRAGEFTDEVAEDYLIKHRGDLK